MCLSTAYIDDMDDDRIVMKNVMTVECVGGQVLLTDIMERTCAVDGTLVKASLVDGYVIVHAEQ